MAKAALVDGLEMDGGPVFINDDTHLLMNSLNSDSASDITQRDVNVIQSKARKIAIKDIQKT